MAFNQMLYPQVGLVNRRPLSVQKIVIGLLVAGGLGIALTVLVRTFTALVVEAGGSCGSSKGVSYGPCPRGTAPLMVLSIISLVPLVPLTWLMILRSLKARETANRVFGVVLLGAMVVGVYPGLAIFEWAHGKTLDAVWEAPSEQSGSSSEDADGSWVSGSTVVRARFDGLTAYDIATGHQRWAFPIPGRQVLCLMSRHTSGDIGLIGFGAESKPCDQVVAVDLGTGRQLWQQSRTSTSLSASLSPTPDTIDVVGQMAILSTPETITGVDLRTGTKHWSQEPGKNEITTCRFDWAGGGTDQVVAKVDCPRQTARIRALDAATGRKRWESTVPSQADSVNVSLVSASPAVVHVQESGKRGTNNLLFFDGSGQVRAKILTNAPNEPFDTSPAGFTAVPLWKLLAGNGVFVATTRFTKGHYSVIGFDLNDGRRLWSKTFGSSIEALQVDGNQVLVVTGSSARPELHVLSLRDGKQQGDTQVLGLSRMSSSTALYVQGDYYVFVGEKGYSPWYRPLGVTKRK